MPASEITRQYGVFSAERLAGDLAAKPLSPETIDRLLWPHLEQAGAPLFRNDYTVVSVPVVEFVPGDPYRTDPTDRTKIEKPPFTPQSVFSVTSPNEAAAQRFREAARRLIAQIDSPLLALGADPVMGAADFSFPEIPDGALVGTWEDASRLIGDDQLPLNLDGTKVNVVVVDAGIDKTIVPLAGHFAGGWYLTSSGNPIEPPQLPPGMTKGVDALHGMMVVNNILAIAPQARIFDVPLIRPPKIWDIGSFLSVAEAVFHQILASIQWFQTVGLFPGPWVFVNAWAIYDRRSEASLGDYTENLGIGGPSPPNPFMPHPFIRRIEQMAARGFDIVFCAGNCGEVCPDGRCGPNDYGPGRGIWGANAHKRVLTAGAVRVDGMWLGYSSEGPGPTPHLYAQKPDLCAPAQFTGQGGGYPPSTGTSASAAVSAGVVAALRSEGGWGQQTVPPFILRLILNATAVQTQGTGWNPSMGNGILNAFAAYEELLVNYPLRGWP